MSQRRFFKQFGLCFDGTTAGGTELSNTESDITTGRRLITKPAAIYTNFFETQLDPGNYFGLFKQLIQV
jgi:hypothetical protein